MNPSEDRDVPEIYRDNDPIPDDTEGYRPGLLTILLTLLVLLAMLTSLIWPLLYAGPRRPPTPTPIPTFLQEARSTCLMCPVVKVNKAQESTESLVVKDSEGSKGSL